MTMRMLSPCNRVGLSRAAQLVKHSSDSSNYVLHWKDAEGRKLKRANRQEAKRIIRQELAEDTHNSKYDTVAWVYDSVDKGHYIDWCEEQYQMECEKKQQELDLLYFEERVSILKRGIEV